MHFLHKILALPQEQCYLNLMLLLQISSELMMLPSLISSASATNILISLCVKAINEYISSKISFTYSVTNIFTVNFNTTANYHFCLKNFLQFQHKNYAQHICTKNQKKSPF